MVTKGIEPAEIFSFFEDICGIPHGSRNEAALAAYIVDFAKARDLWHRTDEMHNVVIKKAGSAGYESAPPLMMQAHIDMVCEKNNDTIHNFTKDPIKLVLDGDFLKADGTTLGADNGIGASFMLALLDSSDIAHPPLECVFTTQEEIGLFGAAALDVSDIYARTLINLDSSREGIITVGCAGGLRVVASFEPVWISMPDGYTTYELSLGGLLGGHSGGDIILERGNANILMARAIHQLMCEFTLVHRLTDGYGLMVVGMNGGSMDNAIPRECSATIAIPSGDKHHLFAKIEQLQADYKKEYRLNEASVSLRATKSDKTAAKALANESLMKLFGLVMLAPSGVLARSLEMENLVETSNNVAVVTTQDDCVTVRLSSRSSVKTRKEFISQRHRLLAEILGVKLEFSGEYPSWEYAPSSRVRDMAKQAYIEQYGKEPTITGVHGGLEPGILGSKIPGLDSIAIGPSAYSLHSPDERVSISSVQRTWTFVKNILAKLV